MQHYELQLWNRATKRFTLSVSIKTEAEVAKPGKEVISSKTHADLNGFFKDFVLKSEMETEATMNKN